MSTPFTSSRDVAAVLGTWSGSERMAIESALRDAQLQHRPVRDRLTRAWRRAATGRRRAPARPVPRKVAGSRAS